MSVVNVWVGATTPSAATVVAKVTGTSARLAVADNAALNSPTFFGPVNPSEFGIVRLTATGLAKNTRYHFAVEDTGQLDTSYHGQFLTHPEDLPMRFTIGAASCAGAGSPYADQVVGPVLFPNRISNSPVFDTIREQALADDWLMFVHLGDRHYYDLGSQNRPQHDLATYHRAYDDVLRQSRQHALHRNVAVAYMYDDHDFGPNDSNRRSPGRDNAVRAYQDCVPHYPRGAAGANEPNFQAFQIGRVQFVLWDCRADRDPTGQSPWTMLGSTQKDWFKELLVSSNAQFLCILDPVQWDGSGRNFPSEREELIDALAAPGGNASKNWLPRMCIVQGDAHSLGFSKTNPWGGFPLFQSAPMDSGTTTQSWRDFSVGERGSYSSLTFDDTGSTITITATCWTNGTAAASYSFPVFDSPAAPATVQSLHPPVYSATNRSYGTSTGGGDYRPCGVVFTAPQSGSVRIHWSGGLRSLSGQPACYLSPEVRAGPIVGSGVVVLGPSDNRSVRTSVASGQTVRAGSSHVVSGLAPGAMYNVQLLHRVTSSTAEFLHRGVIVEPT